MILTTSLTNLNLLADACDVCYRLAKVLGYVIQTNEGVLAFLWVLMSKSQELDQGELLLLGELELHYFMLDIN